MQSITKKLGFSSPCAGVLHILHAMGGGCCSGPPLSNSSNSIGSPTKPPPPNTLLAADLLATLNASEAATVPARHHHGPLLLGPVFFRADAANKLVPQREICGVSVRRREDRVAPAAPLVSTRKENRLRLRFFASILRHRKEMRLLLLLLLGAGGVRGCCALLVDALSAQRVSAEENKGRPWSVVRVVHRQFASGTLVSGAFWHGRCDTGYVYWYDVSTVERAAFTRRNLSAGRRGSRRAAALHAAVYRPTVICVFVSNFSISL
jgi:hypothetical protein